MATAPAAPATPAPQNKKTFLVSVKETYQNAKGWAVANKVPFAAILILLGMVGYLAYQPKQTQTAEVKATKVEETKPAAPAALPQPAPPAPAAVAPAPTAAAPTTPATQQVTVSASAAATEAVASKPADCGCEVKKRAPAAASAPKAKAAKQEKLEFGNERLASIERKLQAHDALLKATPVATATAIATVSAPSAQVTTVTTAKASEGGVWGHMTSGASRATPKTCFLAESVGGDKPAACSEVKVVAPDVGETRANWIARMDASYGLVAGEKFGGKTVKSVSTTPTAP